MGLSWINPLYFSALALLALPVLIHLVQRRQPSGLRFPSLMFLERIPWREKRRLEIRNWLLLLLRCLVLILLVLAFARPFVDRDNAAIADPERSDSIIVIDRSYSLRLGDRWREARDIAARLIDDKRPQDRIGIIAFDAAAEVVSAAIEDRDELHRSLDRLQPGLGVTRLRPAIEQANRLLAASTAGQRRILLISDFRAEPGNIPVIDPNIDLQTFALQIEDEDNAAIAAVSIESPSGATDDQFDLVVDVINHAPQALERRLWLDLNGRRAGEREIRLAAGETRRLRFPAIAAGAGLLRVTVELDEDALAIDNRAHLVYSSEQKVPLLIVEGADADDDRSLYLEQALALSQQPLFRVRRAGWEDLDANELAAWAVIVINDAPVPGGDLGRALEDFVAAGGGLLIALGDAVQGNWPARDDRLLPGSLGRRADTAPGSATRFAAIGASHPLATTGAGSIDLAGARIFSYRGLQAGPRDRVVANYVDGSIALVEREFGEGRVLVLTTTLDPRWNDLVLQPAFVPFMHHVLRYLARFEPYPRDFQIGEIVDLLRYARAASGADAVVGAGQRGDLVIEAPSGREIRRARDTALLEIDEAGFYQVHRATPAEVEVVLAANVDSRESIPRVLDVARFVEDIRASSRPAEKAFLTRGQATELEQRQQLWHWVLAVLLGGLLLEAFYANWITAKRSRRSAV